jgi:alpha-ribazole phosphatase
MRRILLVRHGRPELPQGGRICLGQMDLPLSPQGFAEARSLGAGLLNWKDRPAVYVSPLRRCVETAGCLLGPSETATAVPAFKEIDTGRWDGRFFADIAADPAEAAIYKKRGEDRVNTPFPGGESFTDLQARVSPAFKALAAGGKDILIVAHDGVHKVILSDLTDRPLGDILAIPLGTGRVHCLGHKGDGTWQVLFYNGDAALLKAEAEADALLARFSVPEPIRRHGEAVASRVMALYADLRVAGKAADIDAAALYLAARVHDLARASGHGHAAVGASWLSRAGYPGAAAIVAAHHDFPETDKGVVSAKSLLYLADKTVAGEERVSLTRRFEKSLAKCTTPEARAAHERRRQEALAVEACVQAALDDPVHAV